MYVYMYWDIHNENISPLKRHWNVSVINWKLIYMYRYNIESNARRMINKWNEMQSSPWIFFGKYLLLNSTREDNSNNHINFVSTKKCINFDNKSHLECFKFIQECYLLPNTDPFLTLVIHKIKWLHYVKIRLIKGVCFTFIILIILSVFQN